MSSVVKESVSSLVKPAKPAKNLKKFVADRLTYTTAGDNEVLKSPLKHLAGILQNEDLEEEQSCLSANGQIQMLDNFITMLKNDWFNFQSAQVKAKVKKIYKLLSPLFVKGD